MKPTTFMYDGMADNIPLAIPFPFEIGEWIVRSPEEWEGFREIYANKELEIERLREALVSMLDMFDTVAGKINWNHTFLNAEAIEKMNDAPIQAKKALVFNQEKKNE